MLNSTVLDVAIGLIFMYLLLGLMCTTVNEWVAQSLKMRPVTLKQGIHALIHSDPGADPRFAAGDLNMSKLAARLNTPGDKLRVALALAPGSQLDAETAAAMAERLNALLGQPDLSTRIDVSNVSDATLKNAQKFSLGDTTTGASDPSSKLSRANYDLLTEAYPDEIGGLIRAFYNHPLIKALARPGRHPAYIASRTFAAVLVDIMAGGTVEEVSFEKLVAAIGKLPDAGVRRSLTVLARDAQRDTAKFSKGIEQWYNDAMDRVSGWYKRKAQILTVIVAAGITIFANADTVHVARQLFVNPTVRQRIVSAAADKSRTSTESGLTAEEKAEIGELTGWSAEFLTFSKMQAARAGKTGAATDAFPGLALVSSPALFSEWLMAVVPPHLLGWVLTSIAVSLGAPFWFDTLNKFMNVRSAGTSPNEKGKDLSKA